MSLEHWGHRGEQKTGGSNCLNHNLHYAMTLNSCNVLMVLLSLLFMWHKCWKEWCFLFNTLLTGNLFLHTYIRKSTGITNNINDGSVTCKIPVFHGIKLIWYDISCKSICVKSSNCSWSIYWDLRCLTPTIPHHPAQGCGGPEPIPACTGVHCWRGRQSIIGLIHTDR